MGSESASVPEPKRVTLSDGRELEVVPLKTQSVIEALRVLRENGVEARQLFVATGKEIPTGKKDEKGGYILQAEYVLSNEAIFSIPDLAVALVSTSTGLSRKEVGDLSLQDAMRLMAVVAEISDLAGMGTVLGNLLGAVTGKMTALLSGLETIGSRN